MAAAAQAADAFAARSAADRAGLLRALADALESQRETLVPIADRETALGPARLNGELDRTAFQLRGFATELERGAAHAVVDDPAVAGAPPAGRPHLTRVRVPVGPVAMFSASNFPFAFSVLGGDTASALAAGCPVVVKAHPAHPELSRRTARLARQVVAAQGLPEGVFQFVEGGSVATGVQLVQAPAIAAVAFTGSFKGGTALARVAAERPRPIPFYSELGSVNPLVALPAALQTRGAALAETLAGSICLGAGQFCTSPGVIVVRRDAPGDAFVQTLADKLQALAPHAMLSAGIRAHFDHGVSAWKAHGKVRPLVDGTAAPGATPRPFLAEVQAVDFIADAALHEEVFGSAALVVRTGSARGDDRRAARRRRLPHRHALGRGRRYGGQPRAGARRHPGGGPRALRRRAHRGGRHGRPAPWWPLPRQHRAPLPRRWATRRWIASCAPWRCRMPLGGWPLATAFPAEVPGGGRRRPSWCAPALPPLLRPASPGAAAARSGFAGKRQCLRALVAVLQLPDRGQRCTQRRAHQGPVLTQRLQLQGRLVLVCQLGDEFMERGPVHLQAQGEPAAGHGPSISLFCTAA